MIDYDVRDRFLPEKIHAASSDLIPNCFSIDERTWQPKEITILSPIAIVSIAICSKNDF